jgi:hypothetical protein
MLAPVVDKYCEKSKIFSGTYPHPNIKILQ